MAKLLNNAYGAAVYLIFGIAVLLIGFVLLFLAGGFGAGLVLGLLIGFLAGLGVRGVLQALVRSARLLTRRSHAKT